MSYNPPVLAATSHCLSHRAIGSISDAKDQNSINSVNLTPKVLFDNIYFRSHTEYINTKSELDNKYYLLNKLKKKENNINYSQEYIANGAPFHKPCTTGDLELEYNAENNKYIYNIPSNFGIMTSSRGYLYSDICKAARIDNKNKKYFTSFSDYLLEKN